LTAFIGGGTSPSVESEQNFDRDTLPNPLGFTPQGRHERSDDKADALTVSCAMPERATLEVES
jgi:hypothetical protein